MRRLLAPDRRLDAPVHRSSLTDASFMLLALLVSVTACSGLGDSGAPLTEPESPLPVPGEPLPPAARAGEPLQTDSLSYTAVHRFGTGSYRTYGFRVIARFTNRKAAPVYLASCRPESTSPAFGVVLVGRSDAAGSWGSIFNRAWACVGHDRQLEVLPGATRTDTLELLGPNAFDGFTGQPFGTFDARIRLGYRVQTCRGDGGCMLQFDEGTSNAVDVKVAR